MSILRDYHSKHRTNVMNLLDEGYSLLESTIIEVEEKIRQLEFSGKQSLNSPKAEDIELHESDCRDVHVNDDMGLVSTAQASFWVVVYAFFLFIILSKCVDFLQPAPKLWSHIFESSVVISW